MAKKGLHLSGPEARLLVPHLTRPPWPRPRLSTPTIPCTTIFVKFPVHDDKGKLSQYGDLSKTYFVIWTTTTWTLPGNMAICLNAEL